MDAIEWRLIKVLVVDDDKITLQIMKKVLDSLGCVSEFVENGKQAVEMVKSCDFDLCFMDLFMPEMGGIKATSIIRDELNERLPIIAITSDQMESTKDNCEEVGMSGFIQKPVEPETIKKHILRYGVKKR